MRRNFLRAAALLLLTVILAACGHNDGSGELALERSGIWKLGERYPITYSSLTYIVTYEAEGQPFCMKASRSKDKNMQDDIVCVSRDSKLKTSEGKASYTYYECLHGGLRYFIGLETDGFYIENILSPEEAAELIKSPEAPKGSIKLCEAEWNAQFRTDACNLEILIRPNDSGSLVRSLSSSYQAVTENGDTYYTSSAGDDIVYSDGVSSVQIRQANRAGKSAENYHTLDECKAILAILGSR